ncbi:MAG: YncE family protein [Gammaproteobacteria bacterium]
MTLALSVAGVFASGNHGALARVKEWQQVGRQERNAVVLPTNQVVKPAGEQIEFRGRPNAVKLSPDKKTAAFLNGAYKAIILIDPQTGTVKQEFDAAGSSASFRGIAYSQDGEKLNASQANGRVIVATVLDDGTIALDHFVALPNSTIPYPGGEDGNPYPGGLALSDDNATLYVVLNRNNTLGVIDLATRTVIKEIPVGNAPHDVVVNGDKAYVSNQGGRPADPGDFTRDSSGTPIVADSESGHAVTGTVSVVDLRAGVEVQTIEVGLQPTALLLDGPRLFVANTNSDTVSVIDTASDVLVKTIAVEPFPGSLTGSSPSALALLDGKRLLVSLGRNNALAVYGLSERVFDAVQYQGTGRSRLRTTPRPLVFTA